MNTPEFYQSKLADINHNLRWELTDLINTAFDGCYMREHNDPCIKLPNILGTPIIYEIKTGGSDNIFYRAGMWNGSRISSTSDTYYELRDGDLFEVYKTLYNLTIRGEAI